MLTFTRELPIHDTMIFESCYESELQLEEDFKKELLTATPYKIWMLYKNKLIGESYGIIVDVLRHIDDPYIDDCDDYKHAIYCYSTTILPDYRGKGFASILKSFWLGMCYPHTIVGHSTTPRMKEINEIFGAVHSVFHKNWFGTDRIAHFYELNFNNRR